MFRFNKILCFIVSTETTTQWRKIYWMELNDKLLVKILNDFTIVQLSTVASTCTRLRTIARSVFKLRHNSDCVNIQMKLWTKRRTGKTWQTHYRQTAAILRNFGDLIADLNVNFARPSDICKSKPTNTGPTDRIGTELWSFQCKVL